MINFIEFGNVFNVIGVNNFAHGCNCAGAMGRGIAVQFKDKYPEMFRQYKKLCQKGEFNVGDVFWYKSDTGYVFNLGTQISWKTKARLSDVMSAFDKMYQLAVQNNVNCISMPRIGAGLGGLNWTDVKSGLIELSGKYPEIDVYLIENYVE